MGTNFDLLKLQIAQGVPLGESQTTIVSNIGTDLVAKLLKKIKNELDRKSPNEERKSFLKTFRQRLR